MKPIILLDCDGPLADFTTAYLDALYEVTGVRHHAEEVKQWAIHESGFFTALARASYDDPKTLRRDVEKVVCRKGFCENIRVQPGAQEAVERLQVLGEVWVVTSPFDSSPTWMHERLHWVHKHFNIPRAHIIQVRSEDPHSRRHLRRRQGLALHRVAAAVAGRIGASLRHVSQRSRSEGDGDQAVDVARHRRQRAQRPSRMKHGYARRGRVHPLHRIWREMIQRCTNPNNPRFKSYGARGIRVCERWMVFANFIADVSKRPHGRGVGGRSLYSLDRIDNDKGYEPGNVKWSTSREQSLRTTRTRFLTLRGRRLPLMQWAAELKIPPNILRWRLSNGWSVVRALSTPMRGRK